MTDQASTTEDISSRGQDIYRNRIRSLVEPGGKGKFVVIDVDSGDYEVDDRDA